MSVAFLTVEHIRFGLDSYFHLGHDSVMCKLGTSIRSPGDGLMVAVVTVAVEETFY